MQVFYFYWRVEMIISNSKQMIYYKNSCLFYWFIDVTFSGGLLLISGKYRHSFLSELLCLKNDLFKLIIEPNSVVYLCVWQFRSHKRSGKGVVLMTEILASLILVSSPSFMFQTLTRKSTLQGHNVINFTRICFTQEVKSLTSYCLAN